MILRNKREMLSLLLTPFRFAQGASLRWRDPRDRKQVAKKEENYIKEAKYDMAVGHFLLKS